LGSLVRFVVSQALRTPAYKRCVEEQAGGPIVTNKFVEVMRRQMSSMTDALIESLPNFYFYSLLPHIGEHFITGDCPVAMIFGDDKTIALHTGTPKAEITDLGTLLRNPKCGFLMPLSPYVCVSIRVHGALERHLPPTPIEPAKVRILNDFVRSQSKIFTLAKDKDSLT
jgi:hypothetical protein